METSDLLSDRIEKFLNDLIGRGELKPGDRLPTERALAARFEVSNMPVRQALEKLVSRGMVRKEHGRGNFLEDPSRAQTGRIGFLYSFPRQSLFSSQFAASIMGGIDTEAHQQNKSLLMQRLETVDKRDPVHIVRDTLDLVDGLIVFTPFAPVYRKIESTLRTLPKPAVVVNYDAVGSGIDAVLFDAADNVRQVISFLTDRGHERIGCFCFQGFQSRGEKVNYNLYRRVELFRQIMGQQNLPVNEDHIIGWMELDDFDSFKRVMDGPEPPTAIFCTNDQLGLQIMAFAEKAGISVPDDLSIIGYDGTEQAATSGLTTVSLPFEELGIESVRRVLEKRKEMEEDRARAVRIELPGRLIEGKTHMKNNSEQSNIRTFEQSNKRQNNLSRRDRS